MLNVRNCGCQSRFEGADIDGAGGFTLSAARGAVQSLTKTGLRICAKHDAARVSRIPRILRLVGLRSTELHLPQLGCEVISPICGILYLRPLLNCSEAFLISPRGPQIHRMRRLCLAGRLPMLDRSRLQNKLGSIVTWSSSTRKDGCNSILNPPQYVLC